MITTTLTITAKREATTAFSFMKEKNAGFSVATNARKIAFVVWVSKCYVARYKDIRTILWRENGAIIA